MAVRNVKIEGPYDFDRVLERLALDPLNSVDQLDRSVKVPYYLQDGGGEVITVQAVGTTDEPEFTITFESEEGIEEKQQRMSDIFQWETGLMDMHEHFLQTDLRPIFEEHVGTPIMLEFDPFATIVKSIIHQQLNLKFAFTLTHRFVTTYGWEKDGVWFYPSAEKIAGLTVAELRELQFSQRKAEYVIGLGQKVSSGELDLDALAKQSDEEVIKELTKIRGIGPWTAQSYLLFGLGRPNLFPKADIGIQNAIKQLFEMEQKPTMDELDRFSADWHPYLSYASLYLWRSIE
ncbi:DNA-3-methyladenine glycosylase family protein [Bacillus sp. KH172YL63]|uniref:DNA-3-methyladenine glycosylase family protein n=1 Tax=Bacillus sp. KH172YL63 TaxID=2709784 RepID=UPI0013E48D6F|nr:DNA-3-methyladenine glycosylase [Bacillus sp. KH172YL63]BCB02509.1 putative DNA-3-methyladenine glycosylase YfjP [Bacillus sp. KH172YL63]